MRCATCHGTGRLPTDDGEHWLPCPDCQGRGTHDDADYEAYLAQRAAYYPDRPRMVE